MNALSFLARCFIPGVQRRNDPSRGLLRTLQAVTMLSVIAVRASAATNEVTLNGFSFSPASLTIPAGETVIFRKTEGFHDAVCEQKDPYCGSFTPPSGSNWSLTNQFKTPGWYRYRCTVHSKNFDSNMVFNLKVLHQPERHLMTLANFVFQPSVLTVVAGDSVTFTNVGGFHNAICEQGDPLCGAFPSPTLAPWSTNLTFSTPGTYFYRCTVHSPDFRSGMVATVIVRPPPESILPATISDAHLDAGNIVFSVRGTPALSQVVEGSPDLGQWLPLSTNNSASGLFSYTNALGKPSQFYRVRQ